MCNNSKLSIYQKSVTINDKPYFRLPFLTLSSLTEINKNSPENNTLYRVESCEFHHFHITFHLLHWLIHTIMDLM